MKATQQNDYWEVVREQEQIIRKLFELCDSLLSCNMNLFGRLEQQQNDYEQQATQQAAAGDEQL